MRVTPALQTEEKNKQTDRQIKKAERREEDIHTAPSVFSSGPYFLWLLETKYWGEHTHTHTETHTLRVTADSKAK